MARTTKGKTSVETSTQLVKESRPTPTSLAIAKNGIRTASDFAQLMGALMGDLLEGSVSAEVGNATSKAGSNLLKAVEMQHKYGNVEAVRPKVLTLIGS